MARVKAIRGLLKTRTSSFIKKVKKMSKAKPKPKPESRWVRARKWARKNPNKATSMGLLGAFGGGYLTGRHKRRKHYYY